MMQNNGMLLPIHRHDLELFNHWKALVVQGRQMRLSECISHDQANILKRRGSLICIV